MDLVPPNKMIMTSANKTQRHTRQPCGCVFEVQSIDGTEVLVITPCMAGASCTYVQNAVALSGDDHPIKVVL